MCEQMNIFNAQGYVHLQDFLNKENCAQLTEELKKIVESGHTTKDPQCPISNSIHGAVIFDSLLEQLLPNFEYVSGKKLYPTYAYARLYAPGEELKHHIDRPACEISATLTLGFEGDTWPIYMANFSDKGVGQKQNVITQKGVAEERWVSDVSEIKMNIGDAVLYRGMDKVHWREKYVEGKWQAQVFLHYVDQNGSHAEWKYDKRECLSHHKPAVVNYNIWYFTDAITPDACKKFIQSVESQIETKDAEIGVIGSESINKEIRDVKLINLPTYRGIGATMTGLGMSANHQAWKFNITHANQADYLRYDVDGHYHAHVDTFIEPDSLECRKLTVLIFLNDDFEGGKFYIQNSSEKFYPPQNVGTCLVFPSFMLHGVEPVTKGVRRSVVTWLVGPWFK